MKLVIAGFDGLGSALFEATELLALNEVREASLWGTLRSAEMETGASWTTILTGWLAETHGLRGFMGAVDGKEVYFYKRARDYIFDELANVGYRVGVVNFPTMDVPRPIGPNSWMIAGWPWEPRTYPGTIEVPEGYYTDLADYGHRSIKDLEPIGRPHHHMWWAQQVMDIEEYFAFVRVNQQLRIELATRAPAVDVLMIQCGVMDRAGHLLSYHPDYGGLGASHEAYGQFLQVVEWTVDELLGRFEPEFFALVSDHGFCGRGHGSEGVWALTGPDVAPLRFDTDQENFMPTVLDALGIEVMRDGISVLHRRSELRRRVDVLKSLGYL